MKTATFAVLFTAALIAGCGSSSDTKPAQTTKSSSSAGPGTATRTIKIANYLFSPDPSVVKVGDKVTVMNTDSAPHTLTDKGSDRAFDSGTIKPGASGSVTFTKAGTYDYYCQFHATMAGKVVVRP